MPDGRRQFVIYIGGRPGAYVVRAYDDETHEHIWSSEHAPTIRLGLQEVERALTENASRA